MKKFLLVVVAILIFSAIICVDLGINALIVWGVCELTGYAFSWKWVILLTVFWSFFIKKAVNIDITIG